ncbi:glycosyl hydrolase [Chryseobacterium sp. Leaf180]|uniref:glycoside hydrolase family 127 protein n=1 Tax=Chryseobacterium sp. Leaf180 TaxID=1736289 RepID=UPI0006F26F51|nr:glycoside hydrolase family 127 protein [Chryseobacterium sp. Leaf180]KQR94346.1 glycosyl hydrolase [Chryseobacterium sp. Leaf180]
MRKTFILAFYGASTFAFAQMSKTAEYFPLNQVALSESVFSRAMNTDKNYIMSMDADRLLAPYLKEAGLDPKKSNYPNWENTGLDGHVGGHYITALSLMYASTGDKNVKKRLDYMIDELERCQNLAGNGYLSGVPNGKKVWQEIADGNIRASGFGLNDRWVPLYNIHKIYSGLRDAYWFGESEKAKKMLIKLTDWMANEVSKLSDTQIQDMLRSEHGGLNEVFADVYDITKDQKYLKLAKRFSHLAVLEPLLNQEDKLTGMHANTQIPKVIGYKRIADLEQNKNWSDAAQFFWSNVTQKRSSAIGGNSVSEHFNPTSDFSGMIKSIEGPETCNTYNMLKLTKQLFATQPKSSYLDYYERALYNHILSTQNAEKGGFVYFTPMRPGHYRVYSRPETSFWCCVGSGMENHAKYGEMIYAHSGNNLYVNLFIPSVLKWAEKKAVIRQENTFPQNASTRLIFDVAPKSELNLKLRAPEWTNVSEIYVSVNNKGVKISPDADGFLNIKKKWKKGDMVEIKMPMHLSAEQLPDQSDYYAFRYGPIVLAAKYGTENQTGLFADESRGGHIAHGPQIPLQEIPVVLGSSDSVLNHVETVNKEKLSFKINGLYPQNKFASGLELVPFYQIQEERYIMYFPQATQDKIQIIQQKKKQEEEAVRKLDNITVDKIQLGEQQPESDHFFASSEAFDGYMEDRHFRDAKGWFSYEMRNSDKNAEFLFLQYFDANNNRNLFVEINGIKVFSQDFEGKFGSSAQTLLIPVPVSEKKKEKLIVKFYTKEKSLTPKIIEARLLKNKPE